MLITIHNTFQPAEIEKLTALAAQAQFVDGKSTASGAAARVKNNRQVKGDDKSLEEIRKIVLAGILRSDPFNNYVMPLRIMPPLVNRYEPGMTYGDHIDRPVMQGPYAVRTDLAMTLFLADPTSYDGGELVVSSDLGAQRIKLPRGSLVLYPATTIHRVEPVTRGVRVAVVTWIQSMIREHEKRMLLAELGAVRHTVNTAKPDSPESLQLQKIRANLVRMWADV